VKIPLRMDRSTNKPPHTQRFLVRKSFPPALPISSPIHEGTAMGLFPIMESMVSRMTNGDRNVNKVAIPILITAPK